MRDGAGAMSLTSELADPRSALAQWCAQVFTGTASMADQVTSAVRDVAPVRPEGDVPLRHWAEIGGAFGQRMADLVQPAPPYAALLGLLRAGWISPAWAHDQAAHYPSHRGLPPEHRVRALDFRPAATGWLDLAMPSDPAPRGHAGTEHTWADLLERSRAYLATHAPAGTLSRSGPEAGLARTAWLLTLCEDIYRTGLVDDRLARLFDNGQPAIRQLRGLAEERQVTELVALTEKLHERGTLWQLRQLAGNPAAGQPLGIAAPVIVPGWADGDILLGAIAPDTGIDERGTTLIDVKPVLAVRDPAKIGRWLWQILLYAWLDTGDLYHIRRVGLLLARHGSLVAWTVDDLRDGLLGQRDLGERARDDAQDIVGDILTRHGLPWPVA
ncbi:hypothetical protein NQK81_01110 [Amycolatopsis roodepoortensis]|uniref:hypothetical protein n=1 Tax=Amycolatopsis roodepoortensis TaxID=700274 RepID=UPI00214A94F3|nr:hypothetical protein [Amycolatopsis roodepoortensis]UUV32073.1 hypothetical protein NQK81_01110 [Amycolatopsis roodepoortensis]